MKTITIFFRPDQPLPYEVGVPSRDGAGVRIVAKFDTRLDLMEYVVNMLSMTEAGRVAEVNSGSV